MQRNTPIPMRRVALAQVLTEIAVGLASGDTLEGSIEFLAPMGDDPRDAEVMVLASYRTGQRADGQGGLRLIGELHGHVTPRELHGIDDGV